MSITNYRDIVTWLRFFLQEFHVINLTNLHLQGFRLYFLIFTIDAWIFQIVTLKKTIDDAVSAINLSDTTKTKEKSNAKLEPPLIFNTRPWRK